MANATPATIIDAHVHFYDPSRPEGVPWPDPQEIDFYRTVLPDELRRLAEPLGVRGALMVEASPWLEDNQWALDLAAREPFVLGVVGNLDPGGPTFARDLERFARDPRFRGIRLGAPWRNTLETNLTDARFLADLQALASRDLTLDLVGMYARGPALLPLVIALCARVPGLRIVIQHLPYPSLADPDAQRRYREHLRAVGELAQVYGKVGNVMSSLTPISSNVDDYRPVLDELWATFGEDRLIYESNWPVSARVAPYAAALNLLRAYAGERGQAATDAFFWRNARTAYALPNVSATQSAM